MNEETLEKILSEMQKTNSRLDGIDNRIGTVETRLGDMDTRFDTVETRLDKIEGHLDVTTSQTAKLSEYHTEVMNKLDEFATKKDLEYLQHKWLEHDREIYDIKRKI